MAVDWLTIREDYINGLGSYRKLAEKYGVSFNTLQDRAKREDWKGQKEAHRDKITTETRQKVVEIVSGQEADRVTKLLGISDQFIRRIEKAVLELDRAQVTNKTKTKVIEYKNPDRPDKPTKEIVEEKEEILSVHSIIDRKGLQQVATALKAAWEIANQAQDGTEDIESDGLLDALGNVASDLFEDGDDSVILPEEPEESE